MENPVLDLAPPNLEHQPCFIIYNPHFGPSRFARYQADPFPEEQFLPISPWEDSLIVAHFGCDALAKRAGWCETSSYLLYRIRKAATGC